MNDDTVLFCTVGGSHQPIVTAIRETSPRNVVFFCTGRDPGTGYPGSGQQITGKGRCIKAAPGDEHPSLPNIPAQCGLDAAGYECVLVAADQLDDAFEVMHETIARWSAARQPGARLVADYTGGTKTMSAALVLAALEVGDVDLRLTTGARADLVRVRDGTQLGAPAGIEALRLHRAMAPLLAAWTRHAYDEAAHGLAGLHGVTNTKLRTGLNRARDLSAAFAAWDRYDHHEALRLLDMYAPVVAGPLGTRYAALKILAGEPSPRQEALRIWDLWQNALRRAAAGRFDDAVARAYRIIEWTAQWVLRTRAGLDTADLPAAIANDAGIAPGRDGRHQAALFAAWDLVARHAPGSAAAEFIAEQRNAMLDHLARRNQSILAHGYTPVAEDDWKAMRQWLDAAFVPMLRKEIAGAGIAEPFAQLPDRYLFEE